MSSDRRHHDDDEPCHESMGIHIISITFSREAIQLLVRLRLFIQTPSCMDRRPRGGSLCQIVGPLVLIHDVPNWVIKLTGPNVHINKPTHLDILILKPWYDDDDYVDDGHDDDDCDGVD